MDRTTNLWCGYCTHTRKTILLRPRSHRNQQQLICQMKLCCARGSGFDAGCSHQKCWTLIGTTLNHWNSPPISFGISSFHCRPWFRSCGSDYHHCYVCVCRSVGCSADWRDLCCACALEVSDWGNFPQHLAWWNKTMKTWERQILSGPTCSRSIKEFSIKGNFPIQSASNSENKFMSSLPTVRDQPVPLGSFTLTVFDLMSH